MLVYKLQDDNEKIIDVVNLQSLIYKYPDIWNSCVESTTAFWYRSYSFISLMDYLCELTDEFVEIVNMQRLDDGETSVWYEEGEIGESDILCAMEVIV